MIREGLPENAALMKKQCYDQVEELVTRYGKPDILWYDGGWLAHKGSDTSSAWFWEPGKLNAMVRSHSPETVINPRSGWEGDFYCDEGSMKIQGKNHSRSMGKKYVPLQRQQLGLGWRMIPCPILTG